MCFADFFVFYFSKWVTLVIKERKMWIWMWFMRVCFWVCLVNTILLNFNTQFVFFLELSLSWIKSVFNLYIYVYIFTFHVCYARMAYICVFVIVCSLRRWLKLMRFWVTLRNVKSMINMVKMHSRKEWVVAMIHLTSSSLSLVAAHLEEVRVIDILFCFCFFIFNPLKEKWKWSNFNSAFLICAYLCLVIR